MSLIILWIVVIGFFIFGLAGTFIPLLPGIGLVFLGTLIYGWATGFAAISPWTIAVFGLVAFAAWLADFYSGALGAKLGGGKKYAMGGAILGAIAGAVSGGPGGLALGALLGAFLGALLENNDWQQAGKVAVYSVIAALASAVVQFLIGIAIIVAFFLAIAL